MRFSEDLIKDILKMKPIGFKGRIYSAEFQRSFETEYSVAEIKQRSTEKNKLQLTIDGVSDTNWFRQKYQEFQKEIGINIQPKQDKNRGFGL